MVRSCRVLRERQRRRVPLLGFEAERNVQELPSVGGLVSRLWRGVRMGLKVSHTMDKSLCA